MNQVATRVFDAMRPRFASHLMTLTHSTNGKRVWTYTHTLPVYAKSLLRTRAALIRLQIALLQQMHAIGHLYVHMDAPKLAGSTLILELRFAEYDAIERGQKRIECDALVAVIERMVASVQALSHRRDTAVVVFGEIPLVAEIFFATGETFGACLVSFSFLRALLHIVRTHMPHYCIEFINRARIIFSLKDV